LCICESTTMYWSRNIEETKFFRTKTLTLEMAKKRNNKFDTEFIAWFWSNVSSKLEICANQAL
ncbi:1199_t:CDS:1, partial [Funneliformis geosporum]